MLKPGRFPARWCSTPATCSGSTTRATCISSAQGRHHQDPRREGQPARSRERALRARGRRRGGGCRRARRMLGQAIKAVVTLARRGHARRAATCCRTARAPRGLHGAASRSRFATALPKTTRARSAKRELVRIGPSRRACEQPTRVLERTFSGSTPQRRSPRIAGAIREQVRRLSRAAAWCWACPAASTAA